ncbi:hypothetical protein C7B65_24810 [Phormidesmis priestleyi ULC007]|uniref:Uncharacterized protein n=1 Tax=Phormidesmis priestleyi ULC007 TaxID=1920490 RepID=A0A2T1D4A3_9CYAN|nr:hypothetical protein [Phormidesmis priestleyi]PSB15276.1 hypothetical protein C7B65_24810 [Phormidesmis priestleyi ULC007]
MSDSVLDRIRQNRNRAAVPLRDDPLIAKPQSSEGKTSEVVEPLRTKDRSDSVISAGNTLEDLKTELAKFPETHRHSAIVLEKALDQDLTRYCKDHRITVEVFLEAAWVQVAQDQTLMQEVLNEAKQRYQSRKAAGKLRRLITMLDG